MNYQVFFRRLAVEPAMKLCLSLICCAGLAMAIPGAVAQDVLEEASQIEIDEVGEIDLDVPAFDDELDAFDDELDAFDADPGVSDVDPEGRPQGQTFKNIQPMVVRGRLVLPPLNAPSVDTDEVGTGRIPRGARDSDFADPVPLPESGFARYPGWQWTVRTWEAPNTFSNPRLFDDRMLERHGHVRWGCYQPVASGVRFFTQIPMLPYRMALQHPGEPEYTLGYYRPGDAVPALFQRPPWDRRAIIAESVSVATGFLVLP